MEYTFREFLKEIPLFLKIIWAAIVALGLTVVITILWALIKFTLSFT